MAAPALPGGPRIRLPGLGVPGQRARPPREAAAETGQRNTGTALRPDLTTSSATHASYTAAPIPDPGYQCSAGCSRKNEKCRPDCSAQRINASVAWALSESTSAFGVR